MNPTPPIAEQLRDMVRQRNRELALDALLRAALGVVFTCLTCGFLFWGGWFVGFLIVGSSILPAWQVGALVTVVFLAAAMWSAWQRVEPLAGLQPLTDRQKLLTMLSHATPSV